MNEVITRWLRSCVMPFIAIWIGLAVIAIMAVILQTLGEIESVVVLRVSQLANESEVLKLLGIGLGGGILLWQAVIANRRAKAMENSARAHANAVGAQAKANQNTEQGQRQERLKNAVEHLGNESETIRLGGGYELFHLAEDTESLRQTVLNILCSHIRLSTKERAYQQEYSSQPSEEIQSLLTLLFIDEHAVFTGLRINLRESWLNGADLRGARLSGADLCYAHLNEARFVWAHLEKANFLAAHLKEARFSWASLREAHLTSAHMQGASLEKAQLQGSNIQAGNLTAANLREASLQGAFLFSAQMYGADLTSARLQAVQLSCAQLQGVTLDSANLQGAGNPKWNAFAGFSERIRESIGEESDLSQVVDGGLTAEKIEQLVNEMSSQTKRVRLSSRLGPYRNSRHRVGFPQDHGAIVGPYTEEDAALWIAEHEAAMSHTAAE